ncbi:MAG: dephospho-CoA kinase [Paludibacteraceae bacterium]|nr:dephospho-CoA kinase [Paludibacteraceae bacterium]
MILGVTGGIGSGKSHVCRLLEIAGMPVFFCDAEAKRLMVEDEYVKSAITDLFGKKAYIEVVNLDDPKDKKNKTESPTSARFTLDKKFIAKKIFSDSTLRDKLDAIVHPAVIQSFREWKDRQNCDFLAVESALIYETGFDRNVDKIVLVVASEEERIERIKKRDGLSDAEIRSRMSSQMSISEKLRKADFIIKNGKRDDLNPQIFTLFQNIGY